MQALPMQSRPTRPSGKQAAGRREVDDSHAPCLSPVPLLSSPTQPAGLDSEAAPGGAHRRPPQHGHALQRPLVAAATDHILSDAPADMVYSGHPIQQQDSASAGAGSGLPCNLLAGRGSPIQQQGSANAEARRAHQQALGGQHQMHASSSHGLAGSVASSAAASSLASPVHGVMSQRQDLMPRPSADQLAPASAHREALEGQHQVHASSSHGLPSSAAPLTDASSLVRSLHHDMSQRPDLVMGFGSDHLLQPSLDSSEGMASAGLAVMDAGSAKQEMLQADVSQPHTYALHQEVGSRLSLLEVDPTFPAAVFRFIVAQALQALASGLLHQAGAFSTQLT